MMLNMSTIRLPYVKSYTDRSGKVRRYIRKPGCKTVPLPGAPGSAEFMAAYQAALGAPRPVSASREHKPGSIGALIVDYVRSPAFSNLRASSQRVCRIVLDRFGTLHGHRFVHDMPRSAAATYIHEIGEAHPGMANTTRAVLRKLLAHAVRMGLRPDNPVTEIDNYKLGTRHTWTEGELAAFEARWPLGTRQRLAYALLLYTGQRGGDVVKMRRADIADGAVAVTQTKTGATLSIPIHPELAAALKAGPVKGLSLIGDRHGRPISREALTEIMKQAAKAAGLSPKCLPHGLRKSAMRRLAEVGASAKEIASVSGHKTLREVERYTAAADQKRLSQVAIAKLKREQPVSNFPPEVSNQRLE
jgi:site-specific recombinase XerD